MGLTGIPMGRVSNEKSVGNVRTSAPKLLSPAGGKAIGSLFLQWLFMIL